jgi:hypothetical protein
LARQRQSLRIVGWISKAVVVLHLDAVQIAAGFTNRFASPAMEAGVSDHVWSLDEVIALLD